MENRQRGTKTDKSGRLKLYRAVAEPAKSVVKTHQNLVREIAEILEKVSQQKSDWDLQYCSAIVEMLNAALVEHPRFLLFAARRRKNGLETSNRFSVLSHQSIRCSIGMLGCCRAAGLSENQVRLGALAGLVHNFGMALIPEEIVTKPAKLNRSELKKMREHPNKGARIPQIAQNGELAQIVGQARERNDGSGYPRGLKDSEIHPLAAFLHAIDLFEALTQPRPYRESEADYNALKIIHHWENGRLQNRPARALLEFYTVYPITTLVELNTRHRGKVVDTHEFAPLSPVLAVLQDANKNAYDEPWALDLNQERHFRIKRVISEDRDLSALASMIC
ncbi:MAG: HD-GYP domain-containing protein [Candidatus Brocadiia bacterium]